MSSESTELYSLLSPLGFGNQRTEAIQMVSKALIVEHHGKVPRSVEKPLSLPHVGLYSAHAVACFAYGRRVPVVEVNVIRVFSRLTGQFLPPDNRRAKAAWDLAWQILPQRHVRAHNYGLLDFSAQICVPRTPHISICPLSPFCAEAQQRQALT